MKFFYLKDNIGFVTGSLSDNEEHLKPLFKKRMEWFPLRQIEIKTLEISMEELMIHIIRNDNLLQRKIVEYIENI